MFLIQITKKMNKENEKENELENKSDDNNKNQSDKQGRSKQTRMKVVSILDTSFDLSDKQVDEHIRRLRLP